MSGPAPSSGSSTRLLGGLLLALGVVILVIGAFLHFQQAGADLPAEPTAAPAGILVLDPLPWAQIVSIRGPAGDVPAGASTTPCRLELPAGTYRVRLEHPALGPRELDLTVRPGEESRFQEPLTDAFDPAAAAREELS